jgi:hypothetical protein
VAKSETAEDVHKLVAGAVTEEIVAEPADGGDVADVADKAAMPPQPPAPPPAHSAKKKTPPLPGVSSLRPSESAADDGDGAGDAAAPDKVRADLMSAESALRGGDYREALYLAERAERDGGGAYALAVMARAHCAMDNVGSAAGALRRIPARRVVLRRSVRAFCAAHRHQLDD